MITKTNKIKDFTDFFRGDNLFIASILTFIMILSLLLYFDLNKRAEGANGKSIGKIIFKRNTVRRKFFSQVVWDDLQQNTLLLNKDSIFTGSVSDATIVLNDGTVIEVGEGSMVIIDISDEKASINLAKGFIQARRSKKPGEHTSELTINSEGQKITMKDGALKLSKTRDKKINLVVQRGKVDVNAKGEKKIVNEGEMAVISKANVDVKSMPIRLMYPADNKRFITSGNTFSVDLRWKADVKKGSETTKEFLLEVSRDRGFSNIIKREKLESMSTRLPLPDGVYYWRLSPANQKSRDLASSNSRKFSIIRQTPLVLLNPVNGTKIEYVSSLPFVQFSWQNKEHASSYKIEISDKKDFSKIIKSVDTQVTRFGFKWEQDLKTIKSVKYYWRVKTSSSLSDLPEQTSPVFNFVVVKKKNIEPPSLVSPSNNKRISQLLFSRNKVLFNWKKSNDIRTSKIYFSKDKDFGKVLHELSTGSNFIVLKENLPRGKYYWRVKGISAKGAETSFSKTRSFFSAENEKLELVMPKNKARIDTFAINEAGIKFAWLQSPAFDKFRFELSGDKSFKKIMNSKTVSSSSVLIKLKKPGEYYWRVKILAKDKTELAASEVRNILIIDKLEEPVVLFPSNRGQVDMSKRDSLEFSWKKSKWATVYEVKIFQLVKKNRSKIKKPVASSTTKDLKFRVVELSKLDIGYFFWTIKAIRKDSTGRVLGTSDTVKINFNITLGDPSRLSASKIKVVSPAIQVRP